MITWIISILIAVGFIASGVLYAIFAPRNRVKVKKDAPGRAVYVNNKGISMDERNIYSIPYEDCNL